MGQSVRVSSAYVWGLWGRAARDILYAEAVVCWAAWVYGVPVARDAPAQQPPVAYYVDIPVAPGETAHGVTVRLVTEWRLAGSPRDYAPTWCGFRSAEEMLEYGTVRHAPF